MATYPSFEKPVKQKSFCNACKSTLPLQHLSSLLEQDIFDSVAE